MFLIEILGPDDVEDDVCAFAAVLRAQARREVFLRVVDGDVRTEEGLGGADLLRVAGGRGHPSTDGLGQLDGHGADAARGPMDEDSFAGLQLRRHDQVGIDRRRDLGQRCRRDQIHAVGDPQNLPRRHGHLLGVAAAGEQRHHLVPHGKCLGHARAEAGNPAGDFQSGDLGGTRRRRVEPPALLHVCTVQARGHDVDQHLAGTGHRGLDLADFQDLGSAGL